MSKIVILGTGAFGLALAINLANFGHDVTCWTAFDTELAEIKAYGENRQKLPGVRIPPYINFSSGLECLGDANLVILSVPTAVTRTVVREAKKFITPNTIVINSSKGLEKGTLLRMTEVIAEELGENTPVVALSGPSHAEEVARQKSSTIVVSSPNADAAKMAQNILNNNKLRVYFNADTIGVELGGALKNIIAIGVGICDGFGFGDNTRAALMTRGMAEIARLGISLGAKHETFAGLTGFGDMIVTCTSLHSRNRRAGILIGSGMSPTEAVTKIGTVEGFFCTEAAYQLAVRQKIEMPITNQINDILFKNKDPRKSLTALMSRPTTDNEADYLGAFK